MASVMFCRLILTQRRMGTLARHQVGQEWPTYFMSARSGQPTLCRPGVAKLLYVGQEWPSYFMSAKSGQPTFCWPGVAKVQVG